MLIGVDGNEANIANRVGTGQYTLSLLKEWQKIASANNQFIIYLSRPPQFWLPEKTRYFSYRIFGPQKLWTQFALPFNLFFKRHRADVFFSPAHYAPRFSPIKTVVTIHDLAYFYYPQEFKKNDLWQLKSWTKYSVKKATKIIAVSENTKKDLIKLYKVNPQKIAVVYNGYDTKRFNIQLGSNQIEKIKRKYRVDGDYIIYLGTLQPRKNIETLIKAFSQVNNHFNRLKLVIAGKKGWLYKSIFTEVRKLGLEKKIIFTDFVPDEDIPFLLAGAQLFVLPSLYEGFGITALESMACGTPVLVSRVSSLPEVVSNAGGYIENPQNYSEVGQKIIQILENPKLQKELSKKGIEQVKKFSWQKCAAETLKAINAISI